MGAKFCFPDILMSSTCTDKKNPCFLRTNKHSQLGTFSLPSLIKLLQIAVTTTVLPKDGSTDSAQEEQLGLPYWTMISATRVFVREVKAFRVSSLSSAAEQRRFAMTIVWWSSKEQLEVEEEDGDRQRGRGRRKREKSNQRGCTMLMTMQMESMKCAPNLSHEVCGVII